MNDDAILRVMIFYFFQRREPKKIQYLLSYENLHVVYVQNCLTMMTPPASSKKKSRTVQ